MVGYIFEGEGSVEADGYVVEFWGILADFSEAVEAVVVDGFLGLVNCGYEFEGVVVDEVSGFRADLFAGLEEVENWVACACRGFCEVDLDGFVL